MSDENDNDFSHSITDLWTTIAVIFLILAVAMIVINKLNEESRLKSYNELTATNEKIQKTKIILVNYLEDIFIKNNPLAVPCIKIESDDNSMYTIKIKINGSLDKCKNIGFFFNSNSSSIVNLKDDLLEKLKNTYNKISEAKFKNDIEKVQILGHTDTDSSINCQFLSKNNINYSRLQCGNMELSSARAINVFLTLGKHIIDQAPSDTKLLDFYTKITEVSGRGPFDPETLSKSDSENLKKDKQRRVEFVIYLKQPIIGL